MKDYETENYLICIVVILEGSINYISTHYKETYRTKKRFFLNTSLSFALKNHS